MEDPHQSRTLPLPRLSLSFPGLDEQRTGDRGDFKATRLFGASGLLTVGCECAFTIPYRRMGSGIFAQRLPYS
jgi:hypothetical protein